MQHFYTHCFVCSLEQKISLARYLFKLISHSHNSGLCNYYNNYYNNFRLLKSFVVTVNCNVTNRVSLIYYINAWNFNKHPCNYVSYSARAIRQLSKGIEETLI